MCGQRRGAPIVRLEASINKVYQENATIFASITQLLHGATWCDSMGERTDSDHTDAPRVNSGIPDVMHRHNPRRHTLPQQIERYEPHSHHGRVRIHSRYNSTALPTSPSVLWAQIGSHIRYRSWWSGFVVPVSWMYLHSESGFISGLAAGPSILKPHQRLRDIPNL